MKKRIAFLSMAVMVCLCLAIPAFAASTPAITAEMLEPVVEGTTANISVVLPIGLGLMGITIGVKLVPKILKLFLNF